MSIAKRLRELVSPLQAKGRLVLRRRPGAGPRWYRDPEKRKKALSTAATVIFGIALAGTVGFVAMVAWFSKDLPDPNHLSDRQVAETTKIFDRTGEVLLYEIHGDQKRTSVELADIAPHAIHATVALEDKAFYQHHGFSIKGILRAVYTDVIRGNRSQGGSTITQQFVKNAVVGKEKTLTRKLKELVLSMELERRFSKDDILKLYLNEIPYGSVAYGIESAAQTFLGKSAKDLTLSESAFLASLPQSPTYYSPYGTHQEDLLRRAGIALDAMAEEGYITKEEAEEAKKDDVLARIKPKNEGVILAPHFVFMVREQLADMYGEQTVEQGGLRVITTLDADKQKIADEAIAKHAKTYQAWRASSAALLSLDPKNGDILALVGSADYFNDEIDGKFNVITGLRQPGSSIKPVIYAAAFEKGYTPDTVMYDVLTPFKNSPTDYVPQNYDLREHGPVLMKQALAGSLNIPAVQTLYLTGIDTAASFAERLGYTTFSNRANMGLSFALGANEVRPIEHIAAFSAFAQDGNVPKTKAILAVHDKTGKKIFESQDEVRQAIAPQIARQIASIMADNSLRAFIFGEKNYLTLPDRQVAAKTGTTNDFKDAWSVGFTPNLVTGVWVGNARTGTMKQGADGSKIAAPIWNDYMRGALKGTPAETFTPPEPVKTGKAVLDGAKTTQQKVIVDRVTGKLATEFTPPELQEERLYGRPHSILYFVDKDNPRGPAPSNPDADPQFGRWEGAVYNWAQRQGLTFDEPPTEFDNIHHPDFSPTVSILQPAEAQTINERGLEVAVSANAPRGVARVDYFIDGEKVASFGSGSFAGFIAVPNRFGKGFHTLTAKAYDDVENVGSSSVTFNLTADPGTLGVEWISPVPGSRIRLFQFPFAVRFGLQGNAAIANLTVIARGPGGSETVIGTVGSPSLGNFSFSWPRPSQTGAYRLIVRTQMKDGKTDNDEINVTVE